MTNKTLTFPKEGRGEEWVVGIQNVSYYSKSWNSNQNSSKAFFKCARWTFHYCLAPFNSSKHQVACYKRWWNIFISMLHPSSVLPTLNDELNWVIWGSLKIVEWARVPTHYTLVKDRMEPFASAWELGDRAPHTSIQGKVYNVAIWYQEHKGADSYYFSLCSHKEISKTLNTHLKSMLHFIIIYISFTALV